MSFSHYTKTSPLSLGTIPASQSKRVCVRRTVTAGAPWTAHDLGRFGVRWGGVAASPAASYLVNQNFEGTGYDNGETWTEYVGTGATVNEDYATSPAPLAGEQSLYVVGGSDDGETYTSFSSSGTIHVRMMIRFTAQTTSDQGILS